MHILELLPKKTAKYGPQIEFTTKHHMFSLKVYTSQENFTQPLVGMVVTFCKSGAGIKPYVCALALQGRGVWLLWRWVYW